MKKTNMLVVVVLSVMVLLVGCKKDKDEVVELDNSTTSSKDNSDAENIFSDMKKVVEEAADDEGMSGKKAGYTFGACAPDIRIL